MRFLHVVKAMQAIRVSALVFGVLGAALSSGACTTAASEEEAAGATSSRIQEKTGTDGTIDKRSQAFASWETSGGASGEAACFLLNETVEGTGEGTAGTREYAFSWASSAARIEARDRCPSHPPACRLETESHVIDSDCDQEGKDSWHCNVTVEMDCNYSIDW